MKKNQDTPLIPRELAIDLLVDEELPEPQRRQLLMAMEAQPEAWRSVALRFLERQEEKRAARAMALGLAPAQPGHRWKIAWAPLRIAAMLAFGLLLGLEIGNFRSPSSPPQPSAQATPANAPTAADLMPESLAISDLPVLPNAVQRHLIMVPQGPNRAVAFPVSVVKQEELY